MHIESFKSLTGKYLRSYRSCTDKFAKRLATAILLLCTSAILITVADAQSTTADIVGTVMDTTGSVIPGATVQLTNLDTRETRSATSDGAGQYIFTLLKPNHYSLKITDNGFKTATVGSFNLAAGDRAREDAHLEVGSEQQVVEVEAQAPALHSDTSVLSTTITEKAT